MTKKANITRDRSGTERVIVAAAKRVLAEQGFSAFGVNSIARAAGCDKQLIYRYFGGLDGLIEVLGREMSDQFGDMLGPIDPATCVTYSDFIEHMLLQLLRALRQSELLLRIAAWEIADASPITRKLAQVRGAALAAWVKDQRGPIAPPTDRDVGAINAALIAAVQHLALSAHAIGEFGGVRLADEADWSRVETAVSTLVRATYSHPDASVQRG
ncbi:TetR/AcrR family transcriptional regulator [Qipengyuania qiaonensis]|uniref:TetR/AcrR family transcriptional regulator n=1 Tax=Qipengyuania qiaonensis TaxID=2867240 RepID=A0ABS7J906_9SPHN|nr:TetR/AcrR family transcriptional regulator [Qipengyuania qiaonensis]MBX7483805.1 TetR/AcrR family transcriptional regulator [Qipengyuania qiaonensis]